MMENIVLTIGGVIKSFGWNDLFFFGTTLFLVLLLVYIVYLMRVENEENDLPIKKEAKENNSIEEIINNIETNYEPKPIDLSKYEQEMEDTAIISYEELKNRAINNIAYEDEYDSGIEDVVVKKVDATNTSSTREYVDLPKAVMMNYDSEEDFLEALQTLQSNLVR